MPNILCTLEHRREPGAVEAKTIKVIISGTFADLYYLGFFPPLSVLSKCSQ